MRIEEVGISYLLHLQLSGCIADQWGLQFGPAFTRGGTSVVLPCESGGKQLVLKLTPDLKIAAEEAAALGAWRGCGHVVSLRDADLDRGALLLERIFPGTRLLDEPDRWPLEDVAPVLSDVWQQRPASVPGGLPALRERAEFLFEITRMRLGSRPAVAGRVPPAVVEGCCDRARELAEQGPVRLLHGDLHPGNVLRSGRGLAVIDPRPCLGDPAFDSVDWVLACGGGEHAIRQRITWLARQMTWTQTAPGDGARRWLWCWPCPCFLRATRQARKCPPWPRPLPAAARAGHPHHCPGRHQGTDRQLTRSASHFAEAQSASTDAQEPDNVSGFCIKRCPGFRG